jgi:hypothetical protein
MFEEGWCIRTAPKNVKTVAKIRKRGALNPSAMSGGPSRAVI